MSEAVIMPSLMMLTSIVSEESFARDRHTDTHRQAHTDTASSIFTFSKSEDLLTKTDHYTCTRCKMSRRKTNINTQQPILLTNKPNII